jgi:hypothetical protein
MLRSTRSSIVTLAAVVFDPSAAQAEIKKNVVD